MIYATKRQLDSIDTKIKESNKNLKNKQDKLIAGDNITIENNVISTKNTESKDSPIGFEREIELFDTTKDIPEGKQSKPFSIWFNTMLKNTPRKITLFGQEGIIPSLVDI